MPLVQVFANPHTVGEDHVKDWFRLALWEIVPSALNSEQGPLTPGSIAYAAAWIENTKGLTVDAFIRVEAFYYDDRAANLDVRAELIGQAMEELFSGKTFAVWPVLVTAGWYRKQPDPNFDGDMSMPAALNRARHNLGRPATVRGGPLPPR